MAYGTSTLTPTFIDRIFEECLTYGGEMDYKTYLDFVLALENRKEPQALAYFFRILGIIYFAFFTLIIVDNYLYHVAYYLTWLLFYLDVRHQGFLNTFCLNYFFRDILMLMEKSNQEAVKFDRYQSTPTRFSSLIMDCKSRQVVRFGIYLLMLIFSSTSK